MPDVNRLVLELLTLKDGELVEDELEARRIELAVLVEVAACVRYEGEESVSCTVEEEQRREAQAEGCERGEERKQRRTGLREDALVDLEQAVERALVDVEAREMRQKVVADKDVDKDEVVDDALEVVLERQRLLEGRELVVEVLAEEAEVHEEEVLVVQAASVREKRRQDRVERGRRRRREGTHLLALPLPPRGPNVTSSRKRQKCGSWLRRPSMMRSASRPYMQWRMFGL